MTDAPDEEAQRIARGLTKAQRRALRECALGVEPRPHPRWCFKEAWRRYMFQLRDKGLMLPASRDARHELTFRGLRVRAALLAMEARDE